MIKFNIEYKEKGKKKKSDAYLPTKWADVSLRQYLEISRGVGGQFQLLEILTGIDRIIWEKVVTKDIDQKLAPLLAFLAEPLKPEKLKFPKYLDVGNDFHYKVPEDLDLETFGQRALLQDAMVDTVVRQKKNLLEIMPYALALYFQPIIDDDDFSEKRANELIDQMEGISCVEAYPVASFFLKKYNVFVKNTTKDLRANPNPRSWLRTLGTSLSTGFLGRSTASQAGT